MKLDLICLLGGLWSNTGTYMQFSDLMYGSGSFKPDIGRAKGRGTVRKVLSTRPCGHFGLETDASS
jgi:hypothetical protein